MPHINLIPGVPGIKSLLVSYPETSGPLLELAQILLRGESSLSEGERELIATYVSHLNQCSYCTQSHASAARHLLSDQPGIVELVIKDHLSAPISEKLKALISIAAKVQKSGSCVAREDVDLALNEGASEAEIHSTVLIAAAFSMYNRYVDGLATMEAGDPEIYNSIGKRLAEVGYVKVKSEE